MKELKKSVKALQLAGLITEEQAKEMLAQKLPAKKIKGASTEIQPLKITVGEYEGKATITLQRGESSFVNRPFTFGKGKAQMIVEAYEAIKAFAESKE